jgi:Rieske Fe-S protein
MSHKSLATPLSDTPRLPRRVFFRWLTAAGGAVAAALVAVPLVGFLFQQRKQRVQWVALGKVTDFPIGETRLIVFDNPLRQPWDGITAHTGVYVRNEGPGETAGDRFRAFAVNCAHLGCPVTWFPQSGLFMCPCHGGVYYADGQRASGPPPRGLFEIEWRVTDSHLEIQAPHYPTLQDTLKQTA